MTTTTTQKSFVVLVRTCYAPKSGGGRYRNPVRIMIVDTRGGVGIKGCYRKNDPAIIRQWWNLDSRYSGPKSAYGQAYRTAEDLCDRWNQCEALGLSFDTPWEIIRDYMEDHEIKLSQS